MLIKKCFLYVLFSVLAPSVVLGADQTVIQKPDVGTIVNIVKSGDPEKIVQSGVNAVAGAVSEASKEMLLGFVPTAEVSIRVSGEYDTQGSILFLAPLVESEDNRYLLFTQGSVQFFDSRTTGNLGFGVRSLAMDDKVLFGINSVYDYEFPNDHQRMSVGAEVRTTVGELNSNYYWGLSGWKGVGGFLQERAMDGFDIELGMPLPYFPRTKFYGQYFKWEAQSGSLTEKGWRWSVEGEVAQGIFVEVGHRDYDTAKDEVFAQLRFNIIEMMKKEEDEKPFFTNTAYTLGSMKEHRYDKVRRENLIRKETRSAGILITVTGF